MNFIVLIITYMQLKHPAICVAYSKIQSFKLLGDKGNKKETHSAK